MKKIERKRDLHGNLVVAFFGTIIALFVGSIIFVSIMRGRVSKEELDNRRAIATYLARRDWKEGNASGRIVNGKAVESGLPAELSKDAKISETESYSDLFKTTTVFEFEVDTPPHRCSIKIGRDWFQVYR